jgi:hypothetical protein
MAHLLLNLSDQRLGTCLSFELLAMLCDLKPTGLGRPSPPYAVPSLLIRQPSSAPDPENATEASVPASLGGELSKVTLDLWEGFTNPVQRRSWLLLKALETNTFEDALELARKAETFVVGR